MNRPPGKGSRVLKLSRLMKAVPAAQVEGNAATEIKGLACDSRAVQPGFLFCALPGEVTHGSQFMDEAARRGAVAILHEPGIRPPRGLASLSVANPRTAMADLAGAFYHHPSDQLKVVGITGTNGKTTTAYMVRDILNRAGMPCGLIGTIQYEWGDRQFPAARTTPESLDLQRMFCEAHQTGCQAMAMEVSSQGLTADRLHGTRIAAAVFTNLTEDHLDFHGSMKTYFMAKKRLFEMLTHQSSTSPAIINIDDEYGRCLAAESALVGRVVSVGQHPDAMVRASGIQLSESGSRCRVTTPWGETGLDLPLAGQFNIQNALCAIGVCGALGVSIDSMSAALSNLSAIPGRLEQIDDPRGRHIFVDYAHTEDALRNVLQSLRETSNGRLICLFGCGGDRDRAKRPLMGAVVSEWADHALITSDNPRTEEPAAILAEILRGIDPDKPHTVELDRALAIRAALHLADPGDTVLIAGKGHEAYQEIAGRMTHFDDREVVREALSEGI
jgi:UDP-N-acetylmuramoyl-L-alanyl-D-glutamate--2,6-diaminopimelate ligase